jgi:glyoxylase-like metal-dependent hydrolase (beta-lactamase superfamily II)
LGAVRLTIGAIDCQLLSDGEGIYTRDLLFNAAPPDELDVAVRGWEDEKGRIFTPYHCLLLRTGEKIAVVDTGLGDLADQLEIPAGRLRESLTAAGVSPAEVDLVIVSHGHPDHIGGLTAETGGRRRPVFPNARHFFWQTEWQFWTSEEGLAQVPDMLAGPARLNLPPLQAAGLVETIDEETDVLPGVRLLPAPGHTPGHLVVAMTSGRAGAIYIADTVVHDLNFEHPDWVSMFEAIPALAVQTRRRLLDRAAEERVPVIGFHLSAPGRVQKAGQAYRFIPME